MNAEQMLRAGHLDAMGVRLLIDPIQPDEVRVRRAPKWMRRLWGRRPIHAMTLGSTIFIDSTLLAAASDRTGRLLVHELVHVRQWHEMGVLRFLWRYLLSYLRGRFDGLGHWGAYLAIPLEVEAREMAALVR